MNDHCTDEGGAVTCTSLAVVVRFLMAIPTNISIFWPQVSRLPNWHELEESLRKPNRFITMGWRLPLT